MANIIKPKRTNTAGNAPTISNLVSGEMGVNMADKKTYIHNGTAVVQIGAGYLSGLADVSVTNPADTQALVYSTALGKWINGAGGGATYLPVLNFAGASIQASINGGILAILNFSGSTISVPVY